MSTLRDLRAMQAGFDPVLVEAVGGEYLLNEGAKLKSVKIQLSEKARDAKALMKEAQSLGKEGKRAQAEKKYDAAIAKLKELEKEAETIEDDNVVVSFLDGMIQSFVLGAGLGLLSMFGIPYTAAQMGAILGGMTIGTLKADDINAGYEDTKKRTPDAKWYKTGESRVATMKKFKNMIKACEDAKKQLR